MQVPVLQGVLGMCWSNQILLQLFGIIDRLNGTDDDAVATTATTPFAVAFNQLYATMRERSGVLWFRS